MITVERKSDVISSGFDGVKFSVADDPSFLIQSIKKLYSDIIGAVVREITANAVDATVENEEDDAIDKCVIYLTKERIYFQDFGTGMSPDFMNNFYTQVGYSTKRKNAKAIGRFGYGK